MMTRHTSIALRPVVARACAAPLVVGERAHGGDQRAEGAGGNANKEHTVVAPCARAATLASSNRATERDVLLDVEQSLHRRLCPCLPTQTQR